MDIDGFLTRYQGLSSLSLKAYEQTLRQLDRFISPHEEPQDTDVRLFLQNIKNASYLQRNKAAIRRYYTYTNRVWPFDRMEFPRPRKRVPKSIPRADVEKIIAQARDEHEYMAIKTLFMLGIRIAELLVLTPERLHDNEESLPGVLILGKRNKERFVPVADKTFWQELKKYSKHFSDDERMFPWDYESYYEMLKRMCGYAGVKKITPHQLRHSRAVDLLNKGMKVNELQQFLGHEDPTTTMTYLRVGSSEVGAALKKIEEEA